MVDGEEDGEQEKKKPGQGLVVMLILSCRRDVSIDVSLCRDFQVSDKQKSMMIYSSNLLLSL